MDGWNPIFKAGNYPQGTITETDLVDIVRTYNPKVHEAPVVLGRPAHDAPAFGWVAALRKNGGLLLARFKQVAPDLIQAVKQGLYKRRIASFIRPFRSPTGKWYLNHVALFDDAKPAVQWIKNAAFSSGQATADFTISDAQHFPFAAEKWPDEVWRMNPEKLALHDRIAAYANKFNLSFIKARDRLLQIDTLTHMGDVAGMDSKNLLHGKIVSFMAEHPDLDYRSAFCHIKNIESMECACADFSSSIDPSRLALHREVIDIMRDSPGMEYLAALRTVRTLKQLR